MTVVIINPGTGPVAGASLACARENVDAFVAELALSPPAVTVTVREQNEGDGRFEFLLRRGICETEVSMPGLSLSRVRYVRGESAWTATRGSGSSPSRSRGTHCEITMARSSVTARSHGSARWRSLRPRRAARHVRRCLSSVSDVLLCTSDTGVRK